MNLLNHKQKPTVGFVDDRAPPTKLPKEAFHVHDEATANWVVRRIIASRQYAKRVKKWSAHESRRAEREERFFMHCYGAQLRAWTEQELARLGKRRKSLNLPGGRVGFRQQHAKLVIDDECQVIDWARTHCPRAVVTLVQLSKTELNDHLEKTGEIPPAGAYLEPQNTSFFVR